MENGTSSLSLSSFPIDRQLSPTMDNRGRWGLFFYVLQTVLRLRISATFSLLYALTPLRSLSRGWLIYYRGILLWLILNI